MVIVVLLVRRLKVCDLDEVFVLRLYLHSMRHLVMLV